MYDYYHKDYVHCDGTQLRLTDSDLGSEKYSTIDYYLWRNDETRDHQLLFIFPTRVNWTTITLHYYSSSFSARGLPRLRFYAVPDDFNVWDVPSTNYSHIEVAAVPPGGEPAGLRNIGINNYANANITKKVLMVKLRSNFTFALSEAEFFQSSTYIYL